MSRTKAQGRAPGLAIDERNDRLGRVRDRLAERDLDGLVVYGDGPTAPDPIRYLTGHVHVFPRARSALVLPRNGDPIFLIDRPWYRTETRAMTGFEDIRTIPVAFHADRSALRSTLERAIRDAGLETGRIGLLDLDCPASFYDALLEATPNANVTVVPELWSDLVTSPTDADLERIQRAASIADAGLEAVASACRAGRTEQAVCFEALERMGEFGAEFLHASAISTHVDIGSYAEGRSNLQPFLYTDTTLERGELFWVDLIVCYEGYYVDCDRTISIGEPTAEQRALYDVCREMYGEMVDAVEPGATGAEIWQRGYEVAADAGYGDDLNSIYLGHSTGITISEAPVVSRDESRTVRSGQLLNVEPGLFVPDIGSACIENTLYVTDSGAEPINEASIDLRVA